MNKRWMLLLIAGLTVLQLTGCGKTENNEQTDIVTESAVEESAADSDNAQLTFNNHSEEEDNEQYVTGPAELTCVLPDGFQAAKDEAGLYIHSSYPADSATISYVISDGEEDLTRMDMNDYKEQLEAGFYEDYGDEVTVTILSCDVITVDGRRGIEVSLEYEFKGIGYEQLVYMIYNGTETHVMNYTQEKGGKWMEAFEESGKSIAMKEME